MNAEEVLAAMSTPAHLRIADLPHTGQIARVDLATVRNRFTGEQQSRLTLSLTTGRTLVCERLNLRVLIAALGEDTDRWPGAQITVEHGVYKGRASKALRVLDVAASQGTGDRSEESGSRSQYLATSTEDPEHRSQETEDRERCSIALGYPSELDDV